MRPSASSILLISLRWRSRARSSMARSVSDDARSARSGWFWFSSCRCCRVSLASFRMSSRQDMSFWRKYSFWRSFMNGSLSVGRYPLPLSALPFPFLACPFRPLWPLWPLWPFAATVVVPLVAFLVGMYPTLLVEPPLLAGELIVVRRCADKHGMKATRPPHRRPAFSGKTLSSYVFFYVVLALHNSAGGWNATRLKSRNLQGEAVSGAG